MNKVFEDSLIARTSDMMLKTINHEYKGVSGLTCDWCIDIQQIFFLSEN